MPQTEQRMDKYWSGINMEISHGGVGSDIQFKPVSYNCCIKNIPCNEQLTLTFMWPESILFILLFYHPVMVTNDWQNTQIWK